MKNYIINNLYNNRFMKYAVSLILYVLLFVSISFASNVIYAPSTKDEDTVETTENIFSNPYYLETIELKPSAEYIEEPTGVRVAENLKKFGELSSRYSKNIIRLEDSEDKPVTSDTIKFIKHTQSITIVPDGSYTWYKKGTIGKWGLDILDTSLQHEAQNGFYLVDGKTYYFDENGYMYVGTLMDERDTVYIFSESGELIYKNP